MEGPREGKVTSSLDRLCHFHQNLGERHDLKTGGLKSFHNEAKLTESILPLEGCRK